MAATARQNPISPPRGMSRRQAAAYWGVSPGTFAKMVRLGIAPPPMTLPGISRRVYDRHAIDTAITAHRAIRAGQSTGTAG
jgi:hypothetical protein